MAELLLEPIEPFGYYVLLSLLENEKNKDGWTNLNGVWVRNECFEFDHSYWCRVLRVGRLCKTGIKPNDIVRMNKIYSKHEFVDADGNRLFLSKEDNIIAKLEKEENTSNNA